MVKNDQLWGNNSCSRWRVPSLLFWIWFNVWIKINLKHISSFVVIQTERPLSNPDTLRAAADHLSDADERMSRIVSKIGVLDLRLNDDLFFSLVESILSQQLTPKSADSIISRVVSLFPGSKIEPPALIEMDDDKIRSCGVSRQKISCIKNIAEAVLEGYLDVDSLSRMSDEEVIERLIRIKGVGKWTAKMILIFTLGRADVLPFEDLGVLNAIQRAYVLENKPDRETFDRITEKWHPYCSVASLYLWRLKDELPWEKEY